MTLLSQHHSEKSTKLLFMGDSSSGKTGSLVSLVDTGYKLRILDFDNGLDPLVKQIQHRCPDKIDNVEYRTFRDKYKKTPVLRGSQVDGIPKAFTDALLMLDNWKYKAADGQEIDLGRPAEWGEDVIVVIDSSTFLGDAALNWAMAMNPGAKDGRQWYFAAQTAFENCIGLLTSEEFKPNVIVIAHIQYSTLQDGTTQGFPTSVGSALGPSIPTYFNNIALMDKEGIGSSIKRIIRTIPTAIISLKNSAPFAMAPTYPIETGLADFFAKVRGTHDAPKHVPVFKANRSPTGNYGVSAERR
jgi:hypothetical protein